MNAFFAEELARRQHDLPSDFQFCRWKMVPDRVWDHMQIEGGVPIGRYTRGPRKGMYKWSPRNKDTTRRMFLFSVETIKAFAIQWEAETGKCRHCLGDGKCVTGWKRGEGTTYEPCGTCKGTGKAGKP